MQDILLLFAKDRNKPKTVFGYLQLGLLQINFPNIIWSIAALPIRSNIMKKRHYIKNPILLRLHQLRQLQVRRSLVLPGEMSNYRHGFLAGHHQPGRRWSLSGSLPPSS